MSLFYIPPTSTNTFQYLQESAFVITPVTQQSYGSLTFLKSNIAEPNTPVSTTYGHFVVGITYPTNSYYQLKTNIYANYAIKNIWRSPITIYNSYRAYSLNDMAIKQVILLFWKITKWWIYSNFKFRYTF